jgi:hypothetical protein
MKYLKLYENFGKPKIRIISDKDVPYDNMDGSYSDYKRKEVKLEVDGKIVSEATILMDVEVEDFLDKDKGGQKEKKYSKWLTHVKKDLDELYGNSIYISRIKTYEEKNKGYASMILEHIYKLAKKNGCEYITLDSMPASKKFWINRGFEICNNILQYDRTICYYNMIKKL